MRDKNELEIRCLCKGYILFSAGDANILHVDATIKKLMFLSKEHETELFQAFSLVPVISKFQLDIILEQTLSSFEDKTNIVKQPSLEFLLRLCATRDLNKAIRTVGIKEGKQDLGIIVFAKNKETCKKIYSSVKNILEMNENNNLLDSNFGKNKKTLMNIYGIDSSQELDKNMVEKLVIEKIAMLSLED